MKEKSSKNRTLRLSPAESKRLESQLKSLHQKASIDDVIDQIFCQDLLTALPLLPQGFADLLILDPPYNLSIQFGDLKISKTSDEKYLAYVMQWLPATLKLLKPNGSVYICCDWLSSPVIYQALKQCNVQIRNRITWQREKGRGAKSNWKNGMEDIWYGVLDAHNFYFDVEAVKMKRKVLAPYVTADGKPKDWEETADGKFRLTYPSNFWDDISIPYWSMPENTEHPTQKPEKLLAKLILSTCPPQGMVVDPFSGSGSTAVTAQKLGRHFMGIEINAKYASWSLKRLETAKDDARIQGFSDGVFWERNARK